MNGILVINTKSNMEQEDMINNNKSMFHNVKYPYSAVYQ
nr:hypothetical protein [uncultured archaeon]